MNVPDRNTLRGIALAMAAVIIWAGNFIISRGVNEQIGPVRLAFYRWSVATIVLAPFAWREVWRQRRIISVHFKYLCAVALTGIALFNTCVYVAGHYTSAINLSLIGTTTSPVLATIIAIIFLKDRPGILRIAGMTACIAGVLLLISRGSWQTLGAFRFSRGDLWVIAGALAFAIYSILVRQKPAQLSSSTFLFTAFLFGTCMLLPLFIWESVTGPAIVWSGTLTGAIIYLGVAASVVAFSCWNLAIQKIGAPRTVLFGNLIPVFSTIEAVWLLHEEISWVHIASGILVLLGLVLANMRTTPAAK